MASFPKNSSPVGAPGYNANVPQVAQPVADVGALANAVQALKQGMDSLAGRRGSATDRAVTFNDLVNLGLVDSATVVSSTGTVSLTAGTVKEIDTGAGLHGGPITVGGTLTADWHAGSVANLGGHISLSGGTLDAAGFVTTVVAGAGLEGGTITSSGTLSADWQAGSVQHLSGGLSITGTTLQSQWRVAGQPVIHLGPNLIHNGTTLDAVGVTPATAAAITWWGL